MKKLFIATGLLFTIHAKAQLGITEIIKLAVKKVIVAADLKVQKMQNKVIWLQNAQKTLENAMSKLKLSEIKDWTEKQRKIYDEYFQELRKVKLAIANFQRVKDIVESQAAMVTEYKDAWQSFRQDKNFTADELAYMLNIYTGMMNESIRSIDHLFLAVNAFATQMSDAKRLAIVNQVADELDKRFNDLKQFNQQNKLIAIRRAHARGEIEVLKKLYGL